MRNYVFFFKRRKNIPTDEKAIGFKHSKDGITRVAMLSSFFSDIPDTFFCTNKMYSDFKNSIISSIEIYSPKEKIVIDLFEAAPSNENQREFALIGFRKYIGTLYSKLRRQFIDQLFTISFFMLIGVLLVFLVHGVGLNFPEWILYLLDCAGSVLIWQFVGYWAFEFIRQYREMKQLQQIKNIEFYFKHWE